MKSIFLTALLLLNLSGQLIAQSSAQPQVFLLNATDLKKLRTNGVADRALGPALARLKEDADKALSAGPFSVVHKTVVPPSGDKRDYMSQAPYFWANPTSPTGLPYIRRDGERNPEVNKLPDHQSMDRMVEAVSTLALAYYFLDNEKYAARATQLLRVWFLDTPTRMNPNLQFGQAIPGINTGRGIGLIETRGLTRVVDAVGLFATSKSFTKQDRRGLEDWFRAFLTWMQEHKYGRDEAAALNNHGTYYDLQAASFALFLGERKLAREILETSKVMNASRDRSKPMAHSLWSLHGRAGGATALVTLMV